MEAYKKASPFSYRVGPDTPPLLLIYGVSDDQVPVDTADRFVLDLGRAGAPGRELLPDGLRLPLPALARAGSPASGRSSTSSSSARSCTPETAQGGHPTRRGPK